jgi:hypothetical protein
LEPFVSEDNHWMVKHHGVFQGYGFFHYLGRDRHQHEQFRDHPCYERTREFIETYDAPAFEPDVETYPLGLFEPMVRNVFAKPRKALYTLFMEECVLPPLKQLQPNSQLAESGDDRPGCPYQKLHPLTAPCPYQKPYTL